MEDLNDQLNTANDPIQPALPKSAYQIFPFFNTRQAGFLILLLAVIFYSPSINNEYALDDGIIIHQNNHVIKGVRGIKEIITHDAYHAFYERMNATDQLQGGRYRPLPTISFAIEQEIFGPYRSGYYMMAEDLNRNNIIDSGLVSFQNLSGNWRTGYEFNDHIDINYDGQVQAEECYACWDLNKNFHNEIDEDLNVDGVFNEIDCHIYGARLRHFNNIVFYAICCLLIFHLFSRYIFRDRQDLAFLSALIFTIHPIHSEVVANVKGRDDIFSLIFITLCFIYAFRYLERSSFRNICLASFSLFCALMSKEYGVAVYVLIPLGIYVLAKAEPSSFRGILGPLASFLLSIAILIYCDLKEVYLGLGPGTFYFICVAVYLILNVFFFRRVIRARQSAALMIGLFCAGIVYLGFRLNATRMAPGVPDTELLNNPFLLATGAEGFATKIYNLLVYLRLFFFPHPLISDYSYASIPYRSLSDWDFILSFILNGSLLVAGIILSIKRHLLGFALITYYILLLVVSNLIFFTGTMVVETYLFHAGLGMCIVTAYFILWIVEKTFQRKPSSTRTALFLVLIAMITVCGIKAWERSKDWKNDVTLFFKDVKNAPNSVLVLGNAGARWIDLADTREITGISMPGMDSTRFNDYNGTLCITEEELKAGGYKDKREAALHKGVGYLEHAVNLHPRYVNGFLNLGLAYYKLGDYDKAILNWKYAEYLYPNNPYLANYYYVLGNILKQKGGNAFNAGDYPKAAEAYKRLTVITPNEASGWHLLGGVHYNMNKLTEAASCYSKALALDPKNTVYRKTYEVLPEHLKVKYPVEAASGRTAG